ncbi:hypothetical protein [Chroococcidiopsis sp. CCALA 051]|nr:hypothetical protein [Chroococcidiopsis sp. CCALA 051]
MPFDSYKDGISRRIVGFSTDMLKKLAPTTTNYQLPITNYQLP